jgi:hypothetical protein
VECHAKATADKSCFLHKVVEVWVSFGCVECWHRGRVCGGCKRVTTGRVSGGIGVGEPSVLVWVHESRWLAGSGAVAVAAAATSWFDVTHLPFWKGVLLKKEYIMINFTSAYFLMPWQG